MKRKLSTLSTSLVATGCLVTTLVFLAPRAEANPQYNCSKQLYGCRSHVYLERPLPCSAFLLGYVTNVAKRWRCEGSNGPMPDPPVKCTELYYDGTCCNLGGNHPTCDSITAECPCTTNPGGPD